jgi:hypothetical protein
MLAIGFMIWLAETKHQKVGEAFHSPGGQDDRVLSRGSC